jgi:hypothetical protein
MMRLARSVLTHPSTTLSRTGLFTRPNPLTVISDKSVLPISTVPLDLSTRPSPVESTPSERVDSVLHPDPKNDGKLTTLPDDPSKSEVVSINESPNEKIESLQKVVRQELETLKKTRPKRIATDPEARKQWRMKRNLTEDTHNKPLKNINPKRIKTH